MATAPQSWPSRLMALHGQLLRGRRVAGLTQEAVARRLGVGRRTFQRWEDGSIDPSLIVTLRWAEIVGVSITSEADCAISGASEIVAEPETPGEPAPVARCTDRRRLPTVRTLHLRGSTALSTAEQARAWHMLVVEGRTHAAVAAILTAERPHGVAVCTEDEVSAHYRAERSLHFRDRFHGLPRFPLDGENATDSRTVHGKTSRTSSRGRMGAPR